MATTWNSGDKSANVTLSGGSLTATLSSTTLGSVRATASVTAGAKVYIEAQYPVSTSTWLFGFANASFVLSAQPGLTADAFSVRNINSNSLATLFNGTATAVSGIDSGVSSTFRICFDVTAKLFWVTVNDGYWNGSSSANPATGVGGRSLAAINAGPYFPVFSASGTTGAQIIVNFGATSFGYAPPAGFSGMDTNVQAFNASAKFYGIALLRPPTTGASAAKFFGLTLLRPPSAAAAVAKFVGYTILHPAPYWALQMPAPVALPRPRPPPFALTPQTALVLEWSQIQTPPPFSWPPPANPPALAPPTFFLGQPLTLSQAVLPAALGWVVPLPAAGPALALTFVLPPPLTLTQATLPPGLGWWATDPAGAPARPQDPLQGAFIALTAAPGDVPPFGFAWAAPGRYGATPPAWMVAGHNPNLSPVSGVVDVVVSFQIY